MVSPHATMNCVRCGKDTRRSTLNQKYCPACAEAQKRDNWKRSKRKRRAEGYSVPEPVQVAHLSGWDALLLEIVKQALVDYTDPLHRVEATSWLLDRGQDFILATGGQENIENMMEMIDNG